MEELKTLWNCSPFAVIWMILCIITIVIGIAYMVWEDKYYLLINKFKENKMEKKHSEYLGKEESISKKVSDLEQEVWKLKYPPKVQPGDMVKCCIHEFQRRNGEKRKKIEFTGKLIGIKFGVGWYDWEYSIWKEEDKEVIIFVEHNSDEYRPRETIEKVV